MRVKGVILNEEGKVSLTLKELQDLLDESYHEGYVDGGKQTYVYPSWGNQPIDTTPSITWSTVNTEVK